MMQILNAARFQAEDDKRDQQILLDDLLPKDPVQPISFDSLLILLGKLFYTKCMDRLWS